MAKKTMLAEDFAFNAGKFMSLVADGKCVAARKQLDATKADAEGEFKSETAAMAHLWRNCLIIAKEKGTVGLGGLGSRRRKARKSRRKSRR